MNDRALLERTIAMLDRLYDRESTVAEVLSFLIATGLALEGKELRAAFEDAAVHLREILALDASVDRQRDLGCGRTDDLRKLVAEELRRKAKENPRQRHQFGPGSKSAVDGSGR